MKSKAFYWKQYFLEYQYGTEIFEKVDENKYEYMLHAYHPTFGVEIYRICHKNSKYKVYGKIEHHLDRGYIVKMNNITKLDTNLYQHKFYIQRIPKNIIEKQEKHKEQEEVRREYPYTYILYELTLGQILLFSYLVFSSPFFYWAYFYF